METVTISFTKASDSSDSFEEKDVPLSKTCFLVGVRKTNVNKSFTHKIQLALKAVVTIVKDRNTGRWHMADEKGNYDTTWFMNEHMNLENVKLMQGQVIRGTLKDTAYYANKKYCKQLDTNPEKFFTKDNIPVMTAKFLLIDDRGTVWGRGIK